MPKATLEFDLNEPDDKLALETALDADKYKIVLWDIDQMIRSKVKYGDYSEDVEIQLQEVRDKIYDMIQEHQIKSWE